MKRKIPAPKTDRAAEAFVATEDLRDYDLSDMAPMRFEFEKKAARINMRLPQPLLDAVKRQARRRGIPYQRLIREILEWAVSGAK